MNADIQSLPNLLMYQGKLTCGSESVANAVYTPPRLNFLMGALGGEVGKHWAYKVLTPQKTVVFLDTDSGSGGESIGEEEGGRGAPPAPPLPYFWEERVGGGIENRFEASLCVAVILLALCAGGSGEDIGVIAPYHSQLRLLRSSLDKAALGGGDSVRESQTAELKEGCRTVEIETVDRFQGRDKRCIILSTVRSNKGGEVGEVLGDLRRLNVAVSRAKGKLIIVGSASTLAAGSPHWKSLIEFVKQKGWLWRLPHGLASLEGLGTMGKDIWGICGSPSSQ